jgi:ferredoxin
VAASLEFPLTIEVSEECLGTAQCVMSAPELFVIDDDDRSRPLRTVRNGVDLEQARKAARSCPTQAISIKAND